jgi:hypothetical protein
LKLLEGEAGLLGLINKRNPIRSNLDKVLISRECEQKYPKVRVVTMTTIGSDHNPLLLDDGTRVEKKVRGFRFEPAWLTQSEFKRKMLEKWLDRDAEEI